MQFYSAKMLGIASKVSNFLGDACPLQLLHTYVKSNNVFAKVDELPSYAFANSFVITKTCPCNIQRFQ